ncbi:hypothetical protein RJT34_20358 [Clitoria ternatea]|uniref:Secreted protein n=1 Tax=Clitoria ternatea TaxID=43366 RepID=A0AAN9ISP6_CLITE
MSLVCKQVFFCSFWFVEVVIGEIERGWTLESSFVAVNMLSYHALYVICHFKEILPDSASNDGKSCVHGKENHHQNPYQFTEVNSNTLSSAFYKILLPNFTGIKKKM